MATRGGTTGALRNDDSADTAERRLIRAALDHAIFTTDADGRVDYWTAGAEKVLGWTAEEILGRDLALTFTPEDRATGEPEKERILARTEGCAPDVRWHQRADGARVFIDGTSRPIRDDDGRITGFVKIGQDVTSRRVAEDELRESEAGLRDLADTLERRVNERTAALADTNRALLNEIREREAAESERNILIRMLVATEEHERGRLSRELHDRVGQQLTGLLLGLRVLERDEQSNERATRIRGLADLASTLSRDLHSVAVQLRPPALDNLGLERALRSHLEEWSERSGVASRFVTNEFDEAALSGEVEAALYRIIQEVLTNVSKHARATQVTVALEGDVNTIHARVEDDGIGFDPAQQPASGRRSIGLSGVRDRLALLGGRLEVRSAPGEGTTVTVHVPVAAEPLLAPFDGRDEL